MFPLHKNESATKLPCIYDSPCDPRDDNYEKQFCPNNELSIPSRTRRDTLKTGASCEALRHAVAALYRLDDFQTEKIGEGFFSDVFKVTHNVTGAVMVLKLNKRHSNRWNVLKEIQLMNKLRHPNILRLMGVCVIEGQLHALTEYINGGSLHQLIMNRNVDVPQRVRVSIAKDMATGLDYLHSKGVFHRDLTSNNVLIKRLDQGRIRALVCDFGLSTNIPGYSNDGSVIAKRQLSIVGSPYWMSPEVLNGQYYDERSDIFSYGIVLCELIARVEADPDYLPRTDNFGLDYLAFTELCEPNVVPDFLTLAFRCCSIDPKSRPTFAENIRTLNDILSDMKLAADNKDEARKMANCAAKSEEQLPVETPYWQQRKSTTTHRRSHSGDVSTLLSTIETTSNDKARRHALIMCRQDPHYTPRTTNPFASLTKFHGVRKLFGNHSCGSELSKTVAEPSTSLPGSPIASRKSTLVRSPKGKSKDGNCSNIPTFRTPECTTVGKKTSNCNSTDINGELEIAKSSNPARKINISDITARMLMEFSKSLPGSPTVNKQTNSTNLSEIIRNESSTSPGSSSISRKAKGGSSTNLSEIITTPTLPESPKSLPGSPTVSRKTSMNLSEIMCLRRRGSCESGFYSSVGECLSPNSLWGDSGTAVSSLRSLDELEPAELQALCKRASSIYTDSSEDVSSLDWPQSNIQTIVDYFEKKGGGGVSSRIAALRRSLEKQNREALSSSHLTPQRPKCPRLVICEGAVRSKLPLFDKK